MNIRIAIRVGMTAARWSALAPLGWRVRPDTGFSRCSQAHFTPERSRNSRLWLVLFGLLLGMPLSAQVEEIVHTYETAPNTAVLIVHVFADPKHVSLDRSVRVDLTNLANRLGVFQTVPAHQDAVLANTSLGRYDLSVTAVGYLSTHQEINVSNPSSKTLKLCFDGILPPRL